ncbi:HU family DNA-binding protein [Pseudomonas juntendi]|uniref:HU family DNA-binding protein n=1 Tax=Pseudomonas juntendi TaxID=2666183 RepID=A0A7W2JFG8_9PSED|nr:HU family DNA-binding protein [Pseudomonas juntendi]MBA6057987.1 HU family DNA-binding protein [Pseudomonas juntendi]MBA6125071.1 HU family DNA-binding protein [Pseudomonas juntendi]
MNKAELIAQVAVRAELSQAKAQKVVDAFIDGIKASLSTHTHVVLVDFGMFKTVARAARVGRNPQSGKPLEIPPATIVKFRAGKRLKDAVQFSGKFDASTKPRK